MDRTLKLVILLIPLLFSCATLGDCYYSYKTKRFLNLEEMAQTIEDDSYVVLGEFHYNQDIQDAEFNLIEKISEIKKQANHSSVSWEFLNYTDKTNIDEAIEKFRNGRISDDEFLNLLKNKNAKTYLPILKYIAKKGISLHGVNISREIKQKIIKNGMSSIDPKMIPPNFELGSEKYFERFKDVMSDHVSEDELIRYFTVQSFTDSVMAQQIYLSENNHLKFMIVGSFHSDFFDGFIRELQKLTIRSIKTFKLVSKSDNWKKYLSPDRKYGDYADYLVVGGEKKDNCSL